MIVTTTLPTPHLVVFGRDTAGKPHAAWFDEANAELATKAAGLMNMRAVAVDSNALRELAGSLPKGRVFSSGRAFTPLVGGKLYSRLVELTGDTLGCEQGAPAKAEAEPPAATAEPNGKPMKGRPALQVVAGGNGDAGEAKPTPGAANPTAAVPAVAAQPSRVEEIGIGSVVLATTGPYEGWWEAEVIGTNGTMLTLRWRDFTEPSVVRRRTDVGFLPALQG